jgi:tetratricopeptide (TPR) repeat protein
VLVALLLLLATLLAYMGAVANDFAFDDDVYIVSNEQLRDGWTGAAIGWAFRSGYASNWHPLTWLSHLADVEIYAFKPAGHHLTSLLLHAANALVLFLVLRAMTGATWRSALVAALFALHPLHVESVAWISERKDVLSTLFWFLTMGAYTAWVRRGGALRYGLVLLLFALGLLAKQMLVTLPFALLLLDVWPFKRLSFRWGTGARRTRFGRELRARLAEKAPLFALALAGSVATYIAQSRSGAVGDLARFPLGGRLANAVVSYVAYLGKLVWPADLAVFYPYHAALPLWQVGGALLVLAAMTTLALRAVARRPYVAVGWFFYLGTLVPVIGLVQIGEQALADRYTYVPAWGIFLIAAWLAADLVAGRPGRTIAIAAVWIVALAALLRATAAQVGRWANDETLFRHTLAVTRDNYLAHDNLGFTLTSQGRLDEAVPHFEAALAVRPDYAISHNNLGRALIAHGDFDGAIAHLERAVEESPEVAAFHLNLAIALAGRGRLDAAAAEFAVVARLDPGGQAATSGFGRTLARFGALLVREQRWAPAAAILARAVELEPAMPDAEVSLAHALTARGEIATAETHYRRALDQKPDPMTEYYGYGRTLVPQAYFGLGSALAARGDAPAAAAAYAAALDLSPGYAAAAAALAWLEATSEDEQVYAPARAFERATRASRLAVGQDPIALDALAAAFAAEGDFMSAVRYARLAAEAASRIKRTHLAADIEARIARYQAGLAFRQAVVPLRGD